MIKFENTEVFNIKGALRGMRNPKNSWDRSDSKQCGDGDCSFVIGEKDMALASRLTIAGPEHAKYLRQIFISVDITAPLFWWKELDTYKVGVTRNSCSTMHKIHVSPFDMKSFSTEGIKECGIYFIHSFKNYMKDLNTLRELFNDTQEKKYWRALIEMLPSNYNMKSTITMDYQNARNMFFQRRYHKLDEWKEFCKWIESLPYASELIIKE